jgi:hypothetical protein
MLKRITIIAMIVSLGGCEVGCRHVCEDDRGRYVDCRMIED